MPKLCFVNLCLIVLFLFASCQPLLGDDWPQFRGPQRDGRSGESGLLKQWPQDGPPLLWESSGVGKGYSSVAVVGDRVFTIGDDNGKQTVFALDRENGDAIWKMPIGDSNETNYGGSRSTPTVDNGHVYAMTSDASLVCLSVETGDIVWQRDLVADFGAQIMLGKGQYEWQFSESPLVDGDQIVVTPGGSDVGMLALNKLDGQEIWRSRVPDLGPEGQDGAGYASMVIGNAGGIKQYVQLMGRGAVGIRADNGEFLWGYNRVANDVANIPAPIVDGDHVFVSSGYQQGAALIELATERRRLTANEVYFLPGRQFQNHHGGLILDNGYIYTGHGHNKGLPLCIRLADGEVAWGPTRNRGQSSAAIAYADGHLYFRYQNGLMVLIEATSEEYREKGSFMIPDVRAESWSHPAISGGCLFLKEQEKLYCYDIRDPNARP